MFRSLEYIRKCNSDVNKETVVPSNMVLVCEQIDKPLDEIKGEMILIDQVSAREFSRNNFGWPRNTVSMMSLIQNESQAAAVLKMMSQNQPKYNLKEGFNVQDSFDLIRPRSCQMPTEFEDFAQHLANGDMKRLNAAYEKAVKKFESKDVTLDKDVTSDKQSDTPDK